MDFSFKIVAKWEWQSNANPWSPHEQPQWTLYNHINTNLLEKAYQDQQCSADLGNYIVFINSNGMRQQRKDDPHRQRPVKRTEVVEETKVNVRIQRFFGAEKPTRPYNETLGSLEDFLQFFTMRSSEAQTVATTLEEVELSQDLARLNKEIRPLIVSAIQKEAERVNSDQSKEELIKLFQGNFANLLQFYGTILKAYMIEGFLYKNLNRYLREVDWAQLDCLLPYAYCLFKAFLFPKISSACSQPADQQQSQGGNKNEEKMILYRGAQLDQSEIDCYQPQNVTNFSWNAVTSTSKNQEIAESFLGINFNSQKLPVMFIIEVDVQAAWIDIKSISDYPSEEEILLAPGSTFESIKITENTPVVEIRLRQITSVGKLRHQGQMMSLLINNLES